MKIVIIEDEEITSKDLEDTIVKINPEHTVVKRLFSVTESIAFFKENNDFDLIFSDIELGDGLSFEIFSELSLKTPVIFCTAFNEYALKAFEANGIDYVLKPYDQKSIERSLNKVSYFNIDNSRGSTEYATLFDSILAMDKNKVKSVLTYQGERIIPIKVNEIDMVCLENEIVYAIRNGKPARINHTLEELEKMLGPDFFRANRQTIIQRNAIKEVTHCHPRKLKISLTFEYHNQILVSKVKSGQFLRWLTNG